MNHLLLLLHIQKPLQTTSLHRPFQSILSSSRFSSASTSSSTSQESPLDPYKPHVLNSHPIPTAWSKSSSFTPAKLILNLPNVIAVKSSSVEGQSKPLFMYNADDYAPSLSSSSNIMKASNPRFDTRIVEMSPRELIANCQSQSQSQSQQSNNKHYYYTAPLTSPPLIKLLRSSCKGWRSLTLPGVDKNDNTKQTPSIWLGGLGTTTQTHYDVSSNILTNITGFKRVRIWSPSTMRCWKVFPDAHAKARKAQLEVEGDADAGGGSMKVKVRPEVDVVLSGGKSVYIPAFWFHYCEVVHNEDGSLGGEGDEGDEGDGLNVSINVFTSEPIGDTASALLGVSSSVIMKDFIDEFEGIGINAQLKSIVASLIPHLDVKDSTLEDIARGIWEERYLPLLSEESTETKASINQPTERRTPPHEYTTACLNFVNALPGNSANAVDSEGIKVMITSHLIELVAVQVLGGVRELRKVGGLIRTLF